MALGTTQAMAGERGEEKEVGVRDDVVEFHLGLFVLLVS